MKKSWAALCFLTSILLILGTLGCGTSASSTPLTAIAKTSHPLVAQYGVTAFHHGVSAWVEFGPDTHYGRQTSVIKAVDTPIEDQVLILVAGMKPKTTYHMRAHVNWPGGTWVDQDHTFTTGALPASAPPPQFKVAAPSAGAAGLAPAPGVELYSLVSTSGKPMLTSLVTDLQGNVIWYCPIGAFPIKPMQNGHYLLVTTDSLFEVDLACNVVRDVTVDQVNQSLQAGGYDFTIPPNLNVPGGGQFHHDALVLPNGHWIGLVETSKTFTDLTGYPGTTQVVGDALVDIDPNGKVVWAWNAFDHLDVNRHPYFGLPDWTHSNALVYTPDGNLLLSMRAQSWVLKLDYANGTGSGNILWKLGEDGDFTLLGGDPSQWFYGQHYPNLLGSSGSQMTLAVFDDGNSRIYSDGVSCGSSSTAPACYTRGTIYQVDQSTSLATLVWQDAPGFFTFWGGSIGVLSNGNVEFAASAPAPFPSTSVVMEVTHTDSPQIVWQMDITGGNAYRGYRIPSLYPGVTWKQ